MIEINRLRLLIENNMRVMNETESASKKFVK